ncbi:MAG: response regulator transcription factor [Clostridia bacterium]|nr:response regulator transcription factor [Clostridia bacterium]
MDKIKVAIVEDEPQWQRALSEFLARQENISIVWKASTKEEALHIAGNSDEDIIIMDINLHGNECDGIEAALEILNFKKVKIIMLTSLNKEEIITDSFTAGAVNYINKRNYKQLPQAILAAYENNSPLEVLLKEFSRLKEEEQMRMLTPAEKEIFSLIEEGYNKPQAGETLFKSVHTLKNQIRNILKKLNVKSAQEAVLQVKTKGLYNKYNKKP